MKNSTARTQRKTPQVTRLAMNTGINKSKSFHSIP